MTTPARRLAPVLVAALLLAGCSAQPPADRPAGQPPHWATGHLAGQWRLAAIDARPLQADGRTPTLTIEDARLGGHTGVNHFSAPATIDTPDRGDLTLGPAISTKMAGTPEAMAVESAFLGALERVAGYDPAPLADGRLTLLDAQGHEVLRFDRDR